MEEKQLIKEIQALKAIKPRKDWIKETRTQILGEKPSIWDFFVPTFQKGFLSRTQFKPALALAMLVLVLVAGTMIGLTLNNRDNQVVTVKPGASENAEYYLALAEKNLERIIQEEVGEEAVLAAIKDTTEAIRKAAETLPPRAENPEESAKIVERITSFEKKVNDVRAVLGADVNDLALETEGLKQKTKEMILTEMYRLMAEGEIAILERASLNEEQQELLNQAKDDFKNELYLEALEKILELTN